MAFKLGSENRNYRTPSKNPLKFKGRSLSGTASGIAINSVPLDENTVAEATMNREINVNQNIPIDSPLAKRAIKHEKQHIDDIDNNIASYDDHYITFKGQKFKRINVNGEWGIMWKGEFKPDGHKDLDWEKRAIKAENS